MILIIFSFTSKTVDTLVSWYRDLDLNSKTRVNGTSFQKFPFET